MSNQRREMILKNQIGELNRLSDAIEGIAAEWAISDQLIMPITLVLEEAFTNIVNYAYSDTNPHDIGIILELSGELLVLQLKDDGEMYDPTRKEDPDINKPLSEREIGGLGIYLIRQFSEKVEYRRVGDTNVLTIYMRLKPGVS
jgi:anti-sigma regulatory factor (Ser/Thr protein kinase)